MLGRDPKQHRPPRLSWETLIDRLAEAGIEVTEQQLIGLPFRCGFSAPLRAELAAWCAGSGPRLALLLPRVRHAEQKHDRRCRRGDEAAPANYGLFWRIPGKYDPQSAKDARQRVGLGVRAHSAAATQRR